MPIDPKTNEPWWPEDETAEDATVEGVLAQMLVSVLVVSTLLWCVVGVVRWVGSLVS